MVKSKEKKEPVSFLKSQLFRIDKRKIGYTILAIVLGFVVAGIFAWIAGYSPIGIYANLFEGIFGGKFEIGNWLSHSTPIIFTSLSFIVVLRCGLFNIGAEGQLYVGAFAAAWAGFTLDFLPPVIHVIAALLVGMAAGALWGFIPGVLRAKRGSNEFIVSLFLSYIAILFTGWLVSPRGPYHDVAGWANQTIRIAPSAELPRILLPSQLSVAFILAVVGAVVILYILLKTPFGFEVRAVGTNETAARYAGINVSKTMILSFVLGGALAGLAGAGAVLGTHRRFVEEFSPGYGWDGIAGALIARGHPIGAIFSCLLIGGLRAGAMRLDRLGVAPFDIAVVIEALVVFFVVVPVLIRYLTRRFE